MKTTCPDCGKQYDEKPALIGQKMKCADCNSEFEITNPNLKPCPDCFAMVSKRASVCPKCGAPLSMPSPDEIQGETTILVCHPSVLNYFWLVVLGIITIPIVIGIVILLYVWIETHFITYRVTDLRLIVNHGLLARVQHEIWIKDMRGAYLGQTFWQRILRIGDIAIGTAATADTEIRMRGIAKPQSVVDKINKLRH